MKVKGSVLPDYSPLTLLGDQVLVTAVNTAAETTLFSFTLPANSLLTREDSQGPDIVRYGALRLKAFGKLLNNSAGNKDIRLRLYVGATVIFDTGALTFVNNANSKGWSLDNILSCKANSQLTQSMLCTAQLGFASGSIATSAGFNNSLHNDALALALDADQIVKLTVLFSAADTNLSFVLDAYFAEIV